MRNRKHLGFVVPTAILFTMGLSACAGGNQVMRTPAEAKAEALELLDKTERVVDVPWPETPRPTVERCAGGIRFAFFVPVSVDNEAKTTAESLQRFWVAEGLSVSPSENEFRGTGRTLYSATADSDGRAHAAYQISSTSVAVRVVSACAEGALDDYDE